MSVTHWQLLAQERDVRKQRMDERKARAALGYPVLHPGSNFGRHPFVPFADADRHKLSCVKCGRRPEHPIHEVSEAA